MNYARLASVNESTRLTVIAMLVWGIATLAFTQYGYPLLEQGNLGDNDNYMRLYQVQLLLDTGQWYQQPLPQFNPEDGRILHWSRLPDLPVAAAMILHQWLAGEADGIAFAVSVVPAVYGGTLILAVTHLTYRVFGFPVAVLAAISTPLSFAYAKFFPGNIDHHNIQLMLFALFLLMMPLTANEARDVSAKNARWAAVFFSLALLIGLESMPFYLLVMFGLFLAVGSNVQQAMTRFIGLIGLWTALLGGLGLLLTEPFDYAAAVHSDVASLPLMALIGVAGLGCCFGAKTENRMKLKTLVITLLLVSPLVYGFPDMLLGPYHHYPEVLKTFWLDKVQEAIPFYKLLLAVPGDRLTIYVLIALLTPAIAVFFVKQAEQKLLLLLYLVSVVPVLFWQVRVITYSCLLGLPLAAYVIYSCYQRVKLPFVRLLPFVIFTPAISFSLFAHVVNLADSAESSLMRGNQLATVAALARLGIEDKRVLASMSLGAPIVAYSSNSAISAPYHRNIDGNLFAIQTWMSEERALLHHQLLAKKIDYVVVDDRDPFLRYLAKRAPGQSFIHQLLARTNPPWLDYVGGDEHVAIYQVKE
ncbi:hypothetical protein [Vibrio sp. CAU 1672]|uniref:hypothetical protein n=1 Tax=Vibrio sp. CAU 1672 TaxID=3032594 RepID=UPI0023DA1EAE|nr:hypothetical protein [Vibrio sp. CAU 1672]MDF2154439.1 hypothetical protein [Vibrio sp. CAU 1672]